MKLWKWLTGGRPMRFERYLFKDIVNGRDVHLWTDAFDRKWMATGPWSWFRVPHKQLIACEEES